MVKRKSTTPAAAAVAAEGGVAKRKRTDKPQTKAAAQEPKKPRSSKPKANGKKTPEVEPTSPEVDAVEKEDAEESPEEPETPVLAPKGKTPSKPRAKAATTAKANRPAKPTNAAAAKKRKGRSTADKLQENAPVAKPFFVENGSEWHGSDIDLDQLASLRCMRELPAACHILWLLQHPLTLRFSNTLLEYEAALLNPTSSAILEDVFTKLLLKKSERECLTAGIGLKYEWWNKQLREYYMSMYNKLFALLRKAREPVPAKCFSEEDDDDSSSSDETESVEKSEEDDKELTDDEWMALEILKARLQPLGIECPLKTLLAVQHFSYAELSVELRCKILLNLCEAVIDDPVNTDHIRMMEEDDLRVEPLGSDRAGNLFYFFPQFYKERRLYRLEVETTNWSLWAKGDDSFRQMLVAMREIRGRKVRGEQELIDHLEVIVEQIDEEAQQREKEMEKANRRAILEAIPRKRSLRIQVKQIEELEKKRETIEEIRELTMEELADKKRTELLRKVEREAEQQAREQEKEAERAELERKEKEAAMAERESRRLRRLEKEKETEEKQKILELERKKQEEARERRARQRQEAEEAEAAEAAIAAAAEAEEK